MITLVNLLEDVRACDLCASHLPLGPRPVVQLHSNAKVLIIGQAPGTKVHNTGIPWNDPSGDRLRRWLNIDRQEFYNQHRFAIMPMGFCYPGKGKSGDLPPRSECAPKWHHTLLQQLPNIQLTLLIGQYAQNQYLPEQGKSVTERVTNWRNHLPNKLALPHPSPRNIAWFKRNPWFEAEVVPYLQERIVELS